MEFDMPALATGSAATVAMTGESETTLDQWGPQVIELSPATTPSCPYCGGSGDRFHMIWWEQRRLYVCGGCHEYAALTFDRQAEVASTSMAATNRSERF